MDAPYVTSVTVNGSFFGVENSQSANLSGPLVRVHSDVGVLTDREGIYVIVFGGKEIG
jgi:hypothetical protein